MLYRENGQFKTSYRADQQVFPIAQDRIAILDHRRRDRRRARWSRRYLFRAILIPFLILALAALGLNILVGYCGQISLGTGAFMAVGAYAAYNCSRCASRACCRSRSRCCWAACCSTAWACCSASQPAHQGPGLAVATLAAQFFVDWAFLRVKWFTNNSASGSVSVADLSVLGLPIETPAQKYLFCLAFADRLRARLAKNLVRSHIGREWMAIRDMDVAAAVIGIRPVYAKLAFAVSSFIVGVAGALWASSTWVPGNRRRFDRPLVPAPVHDHHRRAGARSRQLLLARPSSSSCRSSWTPARGSAARSNIGTAAVSHLTFMMFGALIVFFLIVEPHGLARLWSIGKEKPACGCSRTDGRPQLSHAPTRPVRRFTLSRRHETEIDLDSSVIAVVPCWPAWRSRPRAGEGAVLPGAGRTAPALTRPTACRSRTATSTTQSTRQRQGAASTAKIAWEECETGYATDRASSATSASRGKNGGDRVPAAVHRHHLRAHREGPGDKIRSLTTGRVRRSESHGRHGVQVELPDRRHLLDRGRRACSTWPRRKAGWTSSRARRSRLVYHDSPTARSRSPCRNAQDHGFELQLLPVTAPGVEQKATWLQIRQSRPDYVLWAGA